MRSLILSSSDLGGGAAKAAFRLHQGLQDLGMDSKMLVQEKLGTDLNTSRVESGFLPLKSDILLGLNSLPLKLYPKKEKGTFSIQWLPDNVAGKVKNLKPDIVNVHWIGKGFVQIETMRNLKQPIVLSLHDMWAFTGGCHYSSGCDLYKKSCGTCPILNSGTPLDISRWIWHRKSKTFTEEKTTIVALSSWMKKCVEESSLFKDFRTEVIPNGIDTDKYQPVDKFLARKLLNIPQDKKIILFGSVNATSVVRKGFHILQESLLELSKLDIADSIEVVVFGASKPKVDPGFRLTAHYLGSFYDDISLSLVYSCADVFVLPSLQDNLPNTLMEAISCGVPCVAFGIGGIPDLIDHCETGFLAEPFRSESLTEGIIWVLEKAHHAKVSDLARKTAKRKYDIEIQARAYADLFEDVTG